MTQLQFAPGAWRYAGALFLLSPLLTAFTGLGGGVAVAAGVFVLWFYRDPDRTPAGPGVVSPADGTVSVVREEDGQVRVGVYMSPRDVHVTRAPKNGYVESVEHRAGAHRPAFSKESERNERVDVDFGAFEVSLIAGSFARRITPYVEAGDTVVRGDRVGHIAFGSRVDVLLPARFDRSDLQVAQGDSVRAGETVIARHGDD